MNVKLVTLITAICILVFNSPVFAKSKTKKTKEPSSIFLSEKTFIISHAAFMKLKPEQQLEYMRELRKGITEFAHKNPIAAERLSKENVLFALLLKSTIPEAQAETNQEKLIRRKADEVRELKNLSDLKVKYEAAPNFMKPQLLRQIEDKKRAVQAISEDVDGLLRVTAPQDTTSPPSIQQPSRERSTVTREERDSADTLNRAEKKVMTTKAALKAADDEAKKEFDALEDAERSLRSAQNSGARSEEQDLKIRQAQEARDRAKRNHEEARVEQAKRQREYTEAVDTRNAADRKDEEIQRQGTERRMRTDQQVQQNLPGHDEVNRMLGGSPPTSAPGDGRVGGGLGSPTPAGPRERQEHACMFGGYVINDTCKAVTGNGSTDPQYGAKLEEPIEIETGSNGKITADPKNIKCNAGDVTGNALCNPLVFGYRVVNGEAKGICVAATKDTTKNCAAEADKNDKDNGDLSLKTAVELAKKNSNVWNKFTEAWSDLCGKDRIGSNSRIKNDPAKIEDVTRTCNAFRFRMQRVCGAVYNGGDKCLNILGSGSTATPPAAPDAGPGHN